MFKLGLNHHDFQTVCEHANTLKQHSNGWKPRSKISIQDVRCVIDAIHDIIVNSGDHFANLHNYDRVDPIDKLNRLHKQYIRVANENKNLRQDIEKHKQRAQHLEDDVSRIKVKESACKRIY